ncbi:MAG: hypothetical protein ACYSYM_13415 [Planctomycetota bacterium]|jgi:hypothetical protein
MKTKWIKKSLCILLCLGPAAAAIAQSNTPSVLDLVQNVDDPELAELIRVAIEHQAKLRQLTQEETLELTHKVTLSYTQIKLFNQQIEEVSRKIEARTGPVEMRYSLLLAKTELEAKRMIEVSNLRKVMGITPRHPFDKKPVKVLNTWLHLDVLDQGVHMLDSLKPFEEYWGLWRLKSSGLLSGREALDFVRERLQNKTNLPIRIDLHHIAATRSSAEDLHTKIISLIREANFQMEAEVSLEPITWDVGSGESTFFIREGTISTFYKGTGNTKRPDGGSKPIGTGAVEPNDLDQHILWRLTHPGNIPLKYRVEHDETSTRLARQTADRVRAVAEDLGIGELVEVERILVESVPKTAFLGRWQTTTRSNFQTIDIQPTGECIFVKSRESASTKGGTSMPGRWFLTSEKIFMDIKDYQDKRNVYLGHLDKQGNLVVTQGLIYRQGSFHSGGGPKGRMVFKKVY